MSRQTENIFQGRWDIILSELYVGDGEWELYHKYEQGDWWWEMLPAREVVIGNSTQFMGAMIEHIKGRNSEHTTYYYDICDKEPTLTIDRSTYLEDEFIDICCDDCFAIESTAESNTYYISIINEPDCPAPYFRYKIAFGIYH